ncbi:MAG: TRM11 family SAM-dependent methyltransferase [Candidatus Nanoperiomorbus sp.]
MIVFVLGRQPEISLAELQAVYRRTPKLLASHLAGLDIEQETALATAKNLGSIVKVAELISDSFALDAESIARLTHHLFGQTTSKITLGVSYYGPPTKSKLTANFSRAMRASLEQSGHSVRLVPSEQAALSTATVLHNKLAVGNPKKVELLLVPAPGSHRLAVAKTIYVQDIGAYTLRDRGRPRRDTRNGMLPPKLAQTMINLARGACQLVRPVNLLDPFCGTGVVLQEASLMGLTTYGSDNNPRMIDYTQTNLDWLARRYRPASRPRLTIADATSFNWQQWLASNRLELIASETYLGRPYTDPPHPSELKPNLHDCNVIIGKFIANLSPQLPSGAGICLGVPAWYIRDHIHHLPCLTELPGHKLRSITTGANLIYHRPDQVVGRELLVLQKA